MSDSLSSTSNNPTVSVINSLTDNQVVDDARNTGNIENTNFIYHDSNSNNILHDKKTIQLQ